MPLRDGVSLSLQILSVTRRRQWPDRAPVLELENIKWWSSIGNLKIAFQIKHSISQNRGYLTPPSFTTDI